MHEILPHPRADTVGIRVSETLTKADFEALRPYLVRRTREYGPLRVLFLMDDWHGWDSLAAAWEDLKMDAALNRHVRRLAMVGDQDWERWLTALSKPLAHGEVRYFDRDEMDDAWAWLQADA